MFELTLAGEEMQEYVVPGAYYLSDTSTWGPGANGWCVHGLWQPCARFGNGTVHVLEHS